MAISETVTRKIGPLPAWGWGAVIVGGYVAYRMISGHGGGSSDAGVLAPYPSAALGTDAGGGGGGGVSGTTGTATTPTTGAVDTTAAALAALQAQIAGLSLGGAPVSYGGGQAVTGGVAASGPSQSVLQAAVTRYRAAVDTMAGYVKTLQAVRNPTAKQQASLKADLSTLAYDKAQLAAAEAALSSYSQGIVTGSGGTSGAGILLPDYQNPSQLPSSPLVTAAMSPQAPFTQSESQAWWAAWQASPFDLRFVAPNTIPSTHDLSPAQLAQNRAIAMTGGLPTKPPANFPFPTSPNPWMVPGTSTWESQQAGALRGENAPLPGMTFPAITQQVTADARNTQVPAPSLAVPSRPDWWWLLFGSGQEESGGGGGGAASGGYGQAFSGGGIGAATAEMMPAVSIPSFATAAKDEAAAQAQAGYRRTITDTPLDPYIGDPSAPSPEPRSGTPTAPIQTAPNTISWGPRGGQILR